MKMKKEDENEKKEEMKHTLGIRSANIMPVMNISINKVATTST